MGVFSDGKTKVTISVENEEESIKNTVAQYPVQRNTPLADHTQRQSKDWTFSGKIYGKDLHACGVIYSKLINWQYFGTLLTYTGAIKHNKMLITDLEKTYEEGGFVNAIKFNMSLTNVRIVNESVTKAKHVGVKKPTQKKSTPKKTGTYVTVRAGNTYWGWSMKYGTSIATLRKWNKWPDRKIPIGKKARVK